MYIGSVYDNQDELLQAVSKLYLAGKCFELDPCFNKGSFYKKWARPRLIGDLKPVYKWCPEMDVRALPWDFWNLESAVFDPPYSIGGGHMAERYGAFNSAAEMFEFFDKALENFHRVLRPGGTLVVKVQDASAGGQNFFSHIHMANYGRENGFELVDMFILVTRLKLRDKRTVSRMATKEHCFFLVFKRVERKIRVEKF
jgi:SAM-dependent methyltransferase